MEGNLRVFVSIEHNINVLPGNLVVLGDCDLLVIAVLDTFSQFVCARAEMWNDFVAKTLPDSCVGNLPLVNR